MKTQWQIEERLDENLFLHLCKLRGFDPDSIRPNFIDQLHDPFLLPDMGNAVNLIAQAKKENWLVVIFGDYDADGTPASALLSLTLDRLEIPHKTIIPNRAEGYGLHLETINNLSNETKLLITVDTGVTAVEEIKLAKSKEIKTIVLDHHLPKEVLPEADALVDPYTPNSKYPFKGLCGCAL